MTATFQWSQTVGSGAGTPSDIGTTGNCMNWKNYDSATYDDYTTYPITAGSNSYEVWLRLHFTGDFNKIQNTKFWKSAGTVDTGCTYKWATEGFATYQQGTTATSSIATDVLPTAQPGSANVSIGGDLAGSLVDDGYTDYVVTQLQTTGSAGPGDTSVLTFTVMYDEN